jgi:murein L,D-transpeptidase YafK
MRILIIFIFLLITTTTFSQKSLSEKMKELKLSSADITILIDKSDRTLSVLADSIELVEYSCVLGFNPVDDKKQEGDGCTPEGTFKIRSMYPHKSWGYFVWIDYPNKESWTRFNRRKRDGEIPNNATIGGEIGIHGVPSGSDSLIDNKVDWTLGCISLKEADIEDLYKSISKNTVIKIRE